MAVCDHVERVPFASPFRGQQRSVGSKMLFETALAVHVDVFAIPFVQ
jgi:hypothetical protein